MIILSYESVFILSIEFVISKFLNPPSFTFSLIIKPQIRNNKY